MPIKNNKKRRKSKYVEFFEILSVNYKEFGYVQIPLTESEICSISCVLLKKEH